MTLYWSLFTHSCRRRAGGGEGGSKGTDEHPHDKEASLSAGARTSACFSFETYSGKVADMKINQCNINEKPPGKNAVLCVSAEGGQGRLRKEAQRAKERTGGGCFHAPCAEGGNPACVP